MTEEVNVQPIYLEYALNKFTGVQSNNYRTNELESYYLRNIAILFLEGACIDA